MKYLILHSELNGIIFEDYEDGSTEAPLGKLKNDLNKYEFPDKKEFIAELDEFNKLRIKFVHNFLSISPQEFDKVGLEIERLHNLAESVLTRYDGIVKGIMDQWASYLKGKIPPPIQSSTPDRI